MSYTNWAAGKAPATINTRPAPESETTSEKVKLRAGQSQVVGDVKFTLSRGRHGGAHLTYAPSDHTLSSSTRSSGFKTYVTLQSESSGVRKETRIEFNSRTNKLRVTQKVDKLVSKNTGGKNAAPSAARAPGPGPTKGAGKGRASGAATMAPTPSPAAPSAAARAGIDAAVRFTDAVIATYAGKHNLADPAVSPRVEFAAMFLRQDVEAQVGRLIASGDTGKIDAVVSGMIAKSLDVFDNYIDPVGRQAKIVAQSSAMELEKRLKEVSKDSPQAASNIKRIVDGHRQKTEAATRALLKNGTATVADAWKKADESADKLTAGRAVRGRQPSPASTEAKAAASEFQKQLKARHGDALNNPVVARRVTSFTEFLQQDVEQIIRSKTGGAPDDAAKAKAVADRITLQVNRFEVFFASVDPSQDATKRQAQFIAGSSAFELRRALVEKFGGRADAAEIDKTVEAHRKKVMTESMAVLKTGGSAKDAWLKADGQREARLRQTPALQARRPPGGASPDPVQKRKALAKEAARAAAERVKDKRLDELEVVGLDNFESILKTAEAIAAFETEVERKVETLLAFIDPNSLQAPASRGAAFRAAIALANQEAGVAT